MQDQNTLSSTLEKIFYNTIFFGINLGSAFIFYARFALLSNADLLSFIYSSLGLGSSLVLDSFFLGMVSYFAMIPLWAALNTMQYREDAYLGKYFGFLFDKVISIRSFRSFALNLMAVLAHVPMVSSFVFQIAFMLTNALGTLIAGCYNFLLNFTFYSVVFAFLGMFLGDEHRIRGREVSYHEYLFHFALLFFDNGIWLAFCLIYTEKLMGYICRGFVFNADKILCLNALITSLFLLFDVISWGSQVLNHNIAFVCLSFLSAYMLDYFFHDRTYASRFFSTRVFIALCVNIIGITFALPNVLTGVLTFGITLITRHLIAVPWTPQKVASDTSNLPELLSRTGLSNLINGVLGPENDKDRYKLLAVDDSTTGGLSKIFRCKLVDSLTKPDALKLQAAAAASSSFKKHVAFRIPEEGDDYEVYLGNRSVNIEI